MRWQALARPWETVGNREKGLFLLGDYRAVNTALSVPCSSKGVECFVETDNRGPTIESGAS